MLWLCLRFPQLPLDQAPLNQPFQEQPSRNRFSAAPCPEKPSPEVACPDSDQHESLEQRPSGTATTEHRDTAPRVVVERQRIQFASASARAAGIDIGMSLNTALALCKDLQALPRNRQQEAASLQALAHWCYQFTPCVSLRAAQPEADQDTPNDTLLLEISTCLRLFHGLDSLLQQINSGLQQQGYCCVASLGHTPQAAWLLGAVADLNPLTSNGGIKPDCAEQELDNDFFLARVRQVPLPLLPLSDKQQRQLRQVGFKTLGDLLDLPRASLARRYSKALARQLDKISGAEIDLQYYIQPHRHFFSERHYLSGLTSVAMLQHPLQELLQELHRFLLDGQLQCQGFSWRFYHFDKSASELAIELSTAQNQYQNFLNLSLLKLHGFRVHAPVETVQLHSSMLLASQAHSRPLFSELGLQARHDRAQLLDTLHTRLGRERLYQLVCLDEHLPEYRQAMVSSGMPATGMPATGVPAASSPGGTPPASPLPLWLLPQARRLGPNLTQLEIISGACRIDSHWWRQRQQRSYFIARDQRGSHWIYYDAERRQWFLQGHFG
nr:DNA polymerase Y family protein [Pseudomaricurvus alcaniphilus]